MDPQLPDQSTVRDALADESTEVLRTDWRTGSSKALQRRRSIVGLSFVGMAAMGAVALLQTGLVSHLPDPPIGEVDADAANLSDDAFEAGVPDGALAVRSLGTTLALATVGGEERARERPAIPLLAGVKSAVGAYGAVKNIAEMARSDQAWCPYRLTGAAASIGIFALAVPEAVEAMSGAADAIREWWGS